MSKLSRILQKCEIFVGILSLAVMVAIIVVNIAFRYILDMPFPWVEELSNMLLIWVGFLGAAHSTGSGKHIAVTVVKNRLSERHKDYLGVVINVIIIVMLVIFIGPSLKAMPFFGISTALRIPEKYVFVVVPVSFALMTIHLIIRTLFLLTKICGTSMKRGTM
jgi:TRAP-type C4-dicarboxylate transport system permease small subunit